MRWPLTFMTSSTRPEQPEIALVVELAAVAGEVATLEPAPIRVEVPLRIAPDAPQHARPGLGQRQVSAAAIDGPTGVVDDLGADAGKREGGRTRLQWWSAPGSGLIMIPPVSVCHQVSTTGHVPPPMFSRYHIHASGLIGSPTDPSSRSDDRSCLAGSSLPTS